MSDLDKNTVSPHILGSKGTVAAHKIVGAYALGPFVRASKATPQLEMYEIQNTSNENIPAFFHS